MKNLNSNAKQIKIKKEQLAERIAQEKQIIREIIMSREYTQKELEAIIFYLEKGKKEQAKKILTKGCFCQKTTKTWQEKLSKAQLLLEMAEKEGDEAEQLRVKETSHLLSNYFKQHEKQH